MLGSIGLPGLIVIAVVIRLLFERGRIKALMGDVGQGITAFRRGLRNEGDAPLKQVAAAPEKERHG